MGLANLPFAVSSPARFFSRHFVAKQRFAQHCDERAVAGKKDCVSRLRSVPPLGRYVEPHECLAGSRHARDEADQLAALLSRLVYEVFDTLRCDLQVDGSCVVTCDVLD